MATHFIAHIAGTKYHQKYHHKTSTLTGFQVRFCEEEGSVPISRLIITNVEIDETPPAVLEVKSVDTIVMRDGGNA